MKFEIAKLVATLVLDDKGFKEKADANKKSSEGLFNSLKQGAVVVGTLVAVFATLKKGFDFAKEGAQILMLEDRFKRLSNSIGTYSDTLLKDMRTATRGLYSDTELMAGANDIMALGLAKNHDQVIRLSKVIGGLNMNMNQLVLTLTNKTTMRFDALGVKVDGFKEKVKQLEKQGMSADDAFNEAFLQQAEQQLLTVGEAADTAAGQFMMFEAAIKNSMDESKKGLAETLLPAVTWWNKEVEAQKKVENALKLTNPELYRQYQTTRLITPEMKKIAAEYELAIGYQDSWKRGLEASSQAMVVAGDVMRTFGEENTTIAGLVRQVADENERYTEKVNELKQEHRELNAEKSELIKKYGEESKKVDEINEKLKENEKAMADNEKKHKEWTNARIGDLLLAKLSVEGLNDAELEYYLGFLLRSGQIDMASAETTLRIVSDAAIQQSALDGNTQSADEYEEELHAILGRLKTLQNLSGSTFTFYYEIIGSGRFPSFPNTDQRTQAPVAPKPGKKPPATPMAEGGTLIADRATDVTFGEAGKEMATFIPLDKGMPSFPKELNLSSKSIRELSMAIVEEVLKGVG